MRYTNQRMLYFALLYILRIVGFILVYSSLFAKMVQRNIITQKQ